MPNTAQQMKSSNLELFLLRGKNPGLECGVYPMEIMLCGYWEQ